MRMMAMLAAVLLFSQPVQSQIVDPPDSVLFGYFPVDVAVDAKGNLFVVDSGASQIFKVTTDGLATVFAGTGVAGFSGDAGPAASAQLNKPLGVAVDAGGSVYIADSGNYRVRKVTTDGLIQTIAGGGTSGYDGDGKPANTSQLKFPVSVAADSAGNIYIADFRDHRIRVITAGGNMDTVAGDGTSGFDGDGGSARFAHLRSPYGVMADNLGNLYIADSGNSRIRRIAPDGKIATIAGVQNRGFGGDGDFAVRAELGTPLGVCRDTAGNLYIVDAANARVRIIKEDGTIDTFAGTTADTSRDTGATSTPQFRMPYRCATDTLGNVFIADPSTRHVLKLHEGELSPIEVISGPMVNPKPVVTTRFGGGVTPPTIAEKVNPQYSIDARMLRIQGTVVLSATINPDGTVTIHQVTRALGFGLDESAIAALRQWRFRPSLRNGEAVPAILNIEVNFNLR
jgi:TonB family protein